MKRKRRTFEIGAVVLTAAGKFIFMDALNLKLPFILCAITAWAVYVIYRSKSEPEMLKHWGLRKDNFSTVARMLMPFGILAVVACFALGHYRGTTTMSWHIIPVLILYPIWGTVQQFLVIALVGGNLYDMRSRYLPPSLTVVVTAVLFGMLHYPFLWLIVGTFILAVFYGAIYLRARNIFVLGLFHGWLGGIFFYTVVGRDPFQEVFGRWLQ